jgi:GNAT superfamily N-acetyltransferase
MTTIEVRTFDVAEWREYRNMRLCALQDSPDAFGSTYEESSRIHDTEWVDRLERVTAKTDFPVKATADGIFAGMAWAKIESSNLDIARLYQMWVALEFRGKGIGKALLLAAIDWSKSRRAKAMQLGVTCGDSPARRLYESEGFVSAGGIEPLRPGSEISIQNMELRFERSRKGVKCLDSSNEYC